MNPLPWFRFYNEARTDPKVQTLPPATFKHWVNLLCLANERGGLMPTKSEIAYELRLSLKQTDALLEILVERRLLDHRPDGALEPHNWEGRQFKKEVSTNRVRRHRERTHGPPGNAHETPNETLNETRKRFGNGARNGDETDVKRLPDFRSLTSFGQKEEVIVRSRTSNLIEREALNDVGDPNSNERTNDLSSEHLKFLGPVLKHLRKQVTEETFQEKFADLRIVKFSTTHVTMALPERVLSLYPSRPIAEIVMVNAINQSGSDLMRGRKLTLVPLEEVPCDLS